MKLTAIILLAAALEVSANGYSQITLSEKNASIQKVFEKIQHQSGYVFWYEDNIIQLAKPVDITVKNAGIDETLQLLFKNQGLIMRLLIKQLL